MAEIKELETAGQYESPRYMELLIQNYYQQRSLKHMNSRIYVPMQGPSELGASGRLTDWDRTADLPKIAVPTLVIGAQFDTMDPAHMEMMASKVQKGRYLFCPNGSHLAMYDDQKVYVDDVIQFVRDVDAGRF